MQPIQATVMSSAFKLGICHPAICVIRNIRVINGSSEVLDKPISTLMEKVKEAGQSFLEKPETKGFRDLFNAMGYPELKPAGERLFTSFSEKGFKRYNNIVDAYNVVAMETVAGIGMHDAEKFSNGASNLVIRRANKGEKITPLGRSKAENVKVDDLVYGCQIDEKSMELMAWLGKQDKDSKLYEVTDKTNSLMLVVLGNKNTTEEYNQKSCEKIFDLIKLTCPEATLDWVPIKIENE